MSSNFDLYNHRPNFYGGLFIHVDNKHIIDDPEKAYFEVTGVKGNTIKIMKRVLRVIPDCDKLLFWKVCKYPRTHFCGMLEVSEIEYKKLYELSKKLPYELQINKTNR